VVDAKGETKRKKKKERERERERKREREFFENLKISARRR